MPWDAVPGKWKAGQLHSGGPNGPVVKSRAQMVAILLSEKRKAAEGDAEYAAKKVKARRKALEKA